MCSETGCEVTITSLFRLWLVLPEFNSNFNFKQVSPELITCGYHLVNNLHSRLEINLRGKIGLASLQQKQQLLQPFVCVQEVIKHI